METILRYGADSEVHLDLSPDVLIADCAAPRGEPLHDVFEVVGSVLMSPLEFPPLRQATVPGDRIVLALEHGVPGAADIVAAVVTDLLENGAAPSDITILRTSQDVDSGVADPRSRLDRDLIEQIAIETHSPTEKGRMSYLAASEKGDPIYLNRTLFDADLIVPIGYLRLDSALGYHGVHDALFPAFSDQETIERFRNTDASQSADEAALRQKEAQEVAWLLGVLFTIQVVPGAGEAVLDVVAGEPTAVFREGSRLCQEAWSCSVPHRASLVVAAIEGGSDRQTWDNVARALSAASRLVADDGAIAICTDLEVPPGPGLQRLAGADDLEAAVRRIRKEKQPDLVPATQLVHALERSKVYFLSRLDEEVVEDLGVAHVADAEEIARLARRHDSCIILANAQLAVPSLAEDSYA